TWTQGAGRRRRLPACFAHGSPPSIGQVRSRRRQAQIGIRNVCLRTLHLFDDVATTVIGPDHGAAICPYGLPRFESPAVLVRVEVRKHDHSGGQLRKPALSRRTDFAQEVLVLAFGFIVSYYPAGLRTLPVPFNAEVNSRSGLLLAVRDKPLSDPFPFNQDLGE